MTLNEFSKKARATTEGEKELARKLYSIVSDHNKAANLFMTAISGRHLGKDYDVITKNIDYIISKC